MAQLRVREKAEAQGLKMLHLQQRAGIAMGTARRYWYNTQDGKENSDKELKVIDLDVLEKIADVLGVTVRDLIDESDLGETKAAA